MIPPPSFLTRLVWLLFYRHRGLVIARVVGFALGLVLGGAIVGLAR